jgi:endonuclease I
MSYQYKMAIPDDYEEMLREWHLSDPPDEWERDRNSLIEDVQGNRNPFIDYPEMDERVRDY